MDVKHSEGKKEKNLYLGYLCGDALVCFCDSCCCSPDFLGYGFLLGILASVFLAKLQIKKVHFRSREWCTTGVIGITRMLWKFHAPSSVPKGGGILEEPLLISDSL